MLTTATITSPNNSKNGKLPPGWHTVKFGDVVRNVQVNVDPVESGLERYVAGEHMDTDDLHIRRWGTIGDGYLGPAFHRKFVKGQVLYGSRRTYLRKVAVAEFDGICANTTFTLEPADDRLIPELLPFIMQTESFTQHSIKQSRGSVNPYVNWKDIAWYEFPLPPKQEQQQIAEILWAADQVVIARKQVVDKLVTLQNITLNNLLKVFSSPDTVSTTLKEICKMQNGRAFSSEDYCDEGIRLLRPGNLGRDGYFLWNENISKFLPNKYLEIASDYLIKPGDVVINLTAQSLEDGFMGRVCIAREGDQSLLNQRIGRFLCNEMLLPEYLFYCLQTTDFRKLVETSCEGSKIKHLYWRHLENYNLFLPSYEEQVEIVKKLSSIKHAVIRAIDTYNQTVNLFQALRENLLTK